MMNEANDVLNAALEIEKENRRKNASKAFSLCAIGIMSVLVCLQFVSVFIESLVVYFVPNIANNEIFYYVLPQACAYMIGLPIMLLLIKKLPNTSNELLPVKKEKISVFAIISLSGFSLVVGRIFSYLAEFIISFTPSQNAPKSSMPFWLYIILGVIVIPVLEEITDRYLTYEKLAGYGCAPYTAFTALFFCMGHRNIYQMVGLIPFAIISGILMYKTGSPRSSFKLHMIHNLMGVGIISFFNEINPNSGNVFLTYIFMGYLLVVAVSTVAGAYLIYKKKILRFEARTVSEATVSTKTAFANPGAIILFVYLMAVTVYRMFY